MGAKLKDIAKALNISISTASYALNGGPRTVPDDVKARVLQTAKEMGYHPNRAARSLVVGRTMILGVVPVVAGPDFMANPYFQGCFAGIAVEAKQAGYDLLLYTHDALNAEALEDVLLTRNTDGLIFVAPFDGLSVLRRMEWEAIPCSVISGHSYSSAPCFLSDNKGGMRSAVEHLVRLGHKKIAHLSGDVAMTDGLERRDGFLEASRDCGIQTRPDWIACGAFSTQLGYESAIDLFAKTDRPTAVVCASDDIAAGVYRAAWELGLKIPEDVSVTGYDDSTLADVLLPRLTSVRQPFRQMGAAAARAVIDLIGGLHPSGQNFNTELILRQSTDRPKEVHSS